MLDRLGRAEALVELGAVDEVLQLDLVVGAALAGLHAVGLHRQPRGRPRCSMTLPGRISLPLILAMMLLSEVIFRHGLLRKAGMLRASKTTKRP